MSTRTGQQPESTYAAMESALTNAREAMQREASIRELIELHEAQQRLAALTAAAVKSARDDAESWATIGAALGMSKQAAQQRFGATDKSAAPTYNTPLPL